MDNVLFDELVGFVRAGGEALGFKPEDIIAAQGTIAIGITGIDIWWSDDALGKGNPGWEIRETYNAIDLLTNQEKFVCKVIGAVPADDVYDTAKRALLAIAERRIDVMLAQHADS